MNPSEQYALEVQSNIQALARDKELRELGLRFIEKTGPGKYSYNFQWLGRPIIQYPQDMIAMQEIIWAYRPDFLIETGIAHGGSLVFYASLLELIGNGTVIGVDIEIREHNRTAINNHPLKKRISMIEGSSVASDVLERVGEIVGPSARTIVVLDSNHTHDHVLGELSAYSRFVKQDGYLVVFDTVIEDMPSSYDYHGRPWGKGSNPKTAVEAFLKTSDRFVVDTAMDAKLLITAAPGGYLKCVRD